MVVRWIKTRNVDPNPGLRTSGGFDYRVWPHRLQP
jgi:hypothetical protein